MFRPSIVLPLTVVSLQLAMSRLRPKTTSPTRIPLYTRGKTAAKEKEERKENAFAGGRRSPSLGAAVRSGHDILALNVKLARKAEPAVAPPRRFAEEPKAKALVGKRRNVLAIRKPNASKAQAGGALKAKAARRAADDSDGPRASPSGRLAKRSFARPARAGLRSRGRAAASSSSDELAWADAPVPGPAPAPAKRRPLHAPPAAMLKKIRLKPGL